MAVQFDIDETLLSDAVHIGGFKTRDDAVNEALKEFIDLKKRQEAMDALWNAEFAEDWCPRKIRGKA